MRRAFGKRGSTHRVQDAVALSGVNGNKKGGLSIINNSLFKGYNFLKGLLLYQPPSDPPPFVLKEAPNEKGVKPTPCPINQAASLKELEALLRYAHRLTDFLKKVNTSVRQGKLSEDIAALKVEYSALEQQQAELSPILTAYDNSSQDVSQKRVSSSLEENRQTIEALYSFPLNKDVIIREIDIAADPSVRTMAVFIDGMVENNTLNLAVLQPLMLLGSAKHRLYGDDLVGRIIKEHLPSNQVQRADTFAKVEEGINSGDTALFFDGIDEVVLVSTKGWEHRSVEKPNTESSVRGGMNAFTENLRTNTAQIRVALRNSDLVTEMIKVGSRSQTNVAILYMKSLANPQLVAEVKRRTKGISTDFLDSSGTLSQFIVDTPVIPFPQTLSTERPDRVAVHLSEGRIAIIVDGNPYIHVLPANFFTFFHSSEDFSMSLLVANFMRLLRLFGTLISTVLPSLYIAINYFHQEALPTELLMAIASSRENVPFPAWFEVMVMEFSFELIREAGVRVPGILGSTIGIVGAIILGQAAVAAHFVSPIVVVIIAITGLSSFTIPEYRMASAIRLLRFFFLLFSILLGLVGLATALLWVIVLLCSMKSFGMPYLVPIAPKTTTGLDVVIRGPVYRQETRPDALNTQDGKRQPSNSRTWVKEQPVRNEDEK